MKTTSRLRAVRRGALAIAAAGILATTVGVGTASAASSSTLLYSTDGGTTWSSTVTADPGQTVLVRQWFDNDGSAAETGSSVETTIPAGFTLQGGSTQVCLNPSTTDPTAPNSSEQKCAASTEGSVWSGSDLQVSPSAGHYGESAGTTVGQLPFGRKRYLNLQQCTYALGTQWRTIAAPTSSGPGANTAASNTAATALSCGPNDGTWTLSVNSSGFQALDLLGNRYLNLQQCSYFETGQGFYTSINPTPFGGTQFDANTNTSNTADAALNCGAPSATYTLQPNSSGFQAINVRNTRYLNLHQCTYSNTSTNYNYTSFNPTPFGGTQFDANTNASNTADTAPSCGPTGPGYSSTSIYTDFEPIDLLATTRGHGYVSYALTAPAAPSAATCAAGVPSTEAFSQTGTLVTSTDTTASSGTLSVDWSQLADPCNTGGIPLAHPGVVAAGVVAVAGAGFVLYRRQGALVA